MSLVDRLKGIITNGSCTKFSQCEEKYIETIEDALNVINKLKKGCTPQYTQASVTRLFDQTVNWIDVLQKDMEIIKADKIRSILADITALRGDMANILKAIEEIKSEPTVVEQPKTKKTKEKKDGNQ